MSDELTALADNLERIGSSSFFTETRKVLSDAASALRSYAAAQEKNALYWAVGRWNAEVLNRPLQNIHRRSLDDTWRQVIRHFGGDDRELCGPTHDDLVDSSQHPHASDCARDVDPIEQHLTERNRKDTLERAGIPSGRTADVTVEEVAAWLKNSGELILEPGWTPFARALLDAFTVGRR